MNPLLHLHAAWRGRHASQKKGAMRWRRYEQFLIR